MTSEVSRAQRAPKHRTRDHIEILAASLVAHFLALALPLALLQVYDRILPSQSYGTTVVLVVGVGVAILLEAMLRYGRGALFANIGARYEADTARRMVERLRHADVGEVERRGTASVADAFRAVASVRDFWSGKAGAALYDLPFVAVYIALVAYIGGWLAVIPVCVFGLAIVSVVVLVPGVSRRGYEAEELDRARNEFGWSTLGAIDYVKATGAEAELGSIWRRLNLRYLAQSAALETRLGWMRENANALGQLSTVLIVGFGAMEVLSGNLTTGGLAACSMLAGRSIGPAMAALAYWSQAVRVRDAQAKLDDILNLPDGPVAGGAIAGMERGEIRIEAPTLLVAPLTIAPGDVVHVDSNDTLLTSRLLGAVAGLSHDPEIRASVDGRPPGDYAADAYRENVVLVTQTYALVPGSILDNLTLYDRRYDDEALRHCEAIGLRPFLDRLRDGLQTEVGAGMAETLDEGICQRISIVRALLRRPRIILFDHAARGVDLDGVKRFAEILRSLKGISTVLVATRKPALIEACGRSIALAPTARKVPA